jgi:hypothetical protein
VTGLPLRRVGWSAINEVSGGCFGTFERRESADDCASKMRDYGYSVRVEEALVPDLRAAVVAFLEAVTDLPGLDDAPDRRLAEELHKLTPGKGKPA